MSDKEKEMKELEHELFEGKLKGVKAQVMSLGDTLHGRIDSLKEDNMEIKELVKETLAQTKQTNGRVTELEKEKIKQDVLLEQNTKMVESVRKNTRVVQFMHKYPKITIFFVSIAYLFTIKEIRDGVIKYAEEFFEFVGKIL